MDYNTRRPHSALAYQTPAAIAVKLTATGLHAVAVQSARSVNAKTLVKAALEEIFRAVQEGEELV